MLDVLTRLLKSKEALIGEAANPTDHEKATGGTLGIFEVEMLGTVPLKHLKLAYPNPKSKAEMSANLMEYQNGVKFALRELQKWSGEAGGEGKFRATPVVLVISSEGIRAVELGSRDMLARIFIENIVFTTEVTARKKRLFTCITFDKHLDRRMCYVFRCGAGESNKVCDSLGLAKQQYKDDLEARQGNPFMLASKLTEPVPPALAELEMPRKDLTPRLAIGAGEFGEVYLADHKTSASAKRRAVKMLRRGATAADRDLFRQEIEINAGMKHANIVQVVGVCFSARPWLVVLELCSYGDLHDLLLACKGKKIEVRPVEQFSWAMQLASGLEYVASRRFVHLDVAARNVFVDAGHRIRVGDFGLAQPYDPGKKYWIMRKATKLSIRWLAQEICGPPPKVISEASDVWAYGVTLWEIVTYARRRPFHRHSLKEVAKLVRRGVRLPQPSRCHPELYKIMMHCWAADPVERPTFSTLVKHMSALVTADGGDIRDVGKLVNDAIAGSAPAREAPVAEKPPARPEPEAVTLDASRDSVALNQMEWDQLNALLDAFDN